jgi:hypothetical protein
MDNAGTVRLREFDRAVARAVVRDQDFPGDARAIEIRHGLPDAGDDRLRLVETGHEDGQFDRRIGVCRGNAGRVACDLVRAEIAKYRHGRLSICHQRHITCTCCN